MAHSAYEVAKPRADGTVPGRKVSDATRAAIREQMRAAWHHERPALARILAERHNLTPEYVMRICNS